MKKSLTALVIDNDEIVRNYVGLVFRSDDWIIRETTSTEFSRAFAGWHEYDLVVCDAVIAKTLGLTDLRQLDEQSAKTKFVVTTEYPNATEALEAIAAGFYDYVAKPLDGKQLRTLSAGLRERLDPPTHVRISKQQIAENQQHSDLIGCSRPFLEVVKQLGRVATTNLPVLLTGESGTGKEIVAAALHQHSHRAKAPFVTVNCGAIPSDLIESELFGHVKGAFTGADRDRVGLWEEASGGTIFLDEVTETSLAFQVKLLRTLQQGEIRRVGTNQTQHVDVRVIAASNRDVEKEVKIGRFRQDLFYRLNAVSIVVPPLRDRKEDTPLLTQTFVSRIAGKSKIRFTSQAFDLLARYPWPGNVRELEHAVVSSVAMCDGIVGVQHLPERIRNFCQKEMPAGPGDKTPNRSSQRTDWPTLAITEREYVSQVLTHTKGNKVAAARLLAVDRKTLDRMIKRHNIPIGNVTNFTSRAA